MSGKEHRLELVLEGGKPWGFRLQGGSDFRAPLQIAKVTPGGKAATQGVIEHDYLVAINGTPCANGTHNEALQLVKLSGWQMTLSIQRGQPPMRPPESPTKTTSPAHSSFSSSSSLPKRSASFAAGTGVRTSALRQPPSTSGKPTVSTLRDTSSPGQTVRLPLASTTLGEPSYGRKRATSDPPAPPAAVLAKPVSPAGEPAASEDASATPVSPRRSFQRPPPPGRGAKRLTRTGSDATSPQEEHSPDIPTEGGQSKDKGWYKVMFRNVHSTADAQAQGKTQTLPTAGRSSKVPPPAVAPKPGTKRRAASFREQSYHERTASSPSERAGNRYRGKYASDDLHVSSKPLKEEGEQAVSPTILAKPKVSPSSKQVGSGTAKHIASSAPAVSPKPASPAGTPPAASTSTESSGATAQLASSPQPPTSTATAIESVSAPQPPDDGSTQGSSTAAKESRQDLPVEEESVEEHQPGEAQQEQSVEEHQPGEAQQEQSVEQHQPDEVQQEQSVEEHQPEKVQQEQSVEEHQPDEVQQEQSVEEHQPNEAQQDTPADAPEPQSSETVEDTTTALSDNQNQEEEPPPVVTEEPHHLSPTPEQIVCADPLPENDQTIEQDTEEASLPNDKHSLTSQVEGTESAGAGHNEDFQNDLSNSQAADENRLTSEAISIETNTVLNLADEPPSSSESPVDKLLSQVGEGEGLAAALYSYDAEPGSGELSFAKGTEIVILQQVDDNWLEGSLNGQRGIFPANYVKIIVPLSNAQEQSETATEVSADIPAAEADDTPQREPSPTPPVPTSNEPEKVESKTHDDQPVKPCAIARFPFPAENEWELRLRKGDLVRLIRKVDENWYEGKVAGKKGLFPASYVEVIRDVGEGPVDNEADKPSPANQTNKDNSTSSADNQSKVPDGERHIVTYSYEAQNDDELTLEEGDTIIVHEQCDDGWFIGTSVRTGKLGTFPGNYVEVM